MSEAYSQELADRICDEIAEGLSRRAVCVTFGLERRMVRSWIARHPEFNEACETVRRLQIDGLVDELVETACRADSKPANTGSL